LRGLDLGEYLDAGSERGTTRFVNVRQKLPTGTVDDKRDKRRSGVLMNQRQALGHVRKRVRDLARPNIDEQ
jgi:hypothetical protein